jgi:PAS domain S-box-containing protein
LLDYNYSQTLMEPRTSPLSTTAIHHIIAERTAAGIVIVTPDGNYQSDSAEAVYRIVFVNPSFYAMIGTTEENLMGKNLLDYVDESDRNTCADVLSLRIAQTLTARHTHSDGTPFYAQIQTTPLAAAQGAERQILCTYTDITDLVQTNEALNNDKERLELDMHRRTNELQEFIDEIRNELTQRSKLETELWRAEKRYRALAENFPNGAVIMINKQRHCLLVEGTQSQRIPIHDNGGIRTLAEPLASEAEQSIRHAFEGKHQSFEITLSGEPYLLSAVPLAMERQHIDAVMVVCQNITDFKTRQHLEKEQEMTELKYRFVTIASHELRTPLAGMMLASGIMRRYWETTSDEEKWEAVQDIITGLDRMASLLDNILMVGKSDSGKLPFEPHTIDLVQFCRELLREYEKSLGQTHSTQTLYNVEELPFLGDPKLLRLIFGNLLSNAYKYSPDGTNVRFSLQTDAENVVITVQDSGIGIASEDLPQLFATFHRGKNVGEIQGSGLGLAIVERSVNMHSGKIEVESTLNVGTTFRVTFPL